MDISHKTLAFSFSVIFGLALLANQEKKPINLAVVTVKPIKSSKYVEFDQNVVEKGVNDWLNKRGILAQNSYRGDMQNAINVQIEIQTVRAPDNVCLYNIQLECSQSENSECVSGKQRVYHSSVVAGQVGDSGFSQKLVGATQRALSKIIKLQSKIGQPNDVRDSNGVIYKLPTTGARNVTVKKQPPAPRYPKFAKEREIRGTVIIDITINPCGQPVEAEAVDGPIELYASAICYALKWEFNPAFSNGEPQWAKFRLRMPFELRDNPLKRPQK